MAAISESPKRFGVFLQSFLCYPCNTQSNIQDTGISQRYDATLRTGLDMITCLCVTFTFEESANCIGFHTKFLCDGIHTAMGETVFYLAEAVKCCTNHNCVVFYG